VSVDELVTAVSIALGAPSVEQCPAIDMNQDTRATVDEIVSAVTNALQGCEY